MAQQESNPEMNNDVAVLDDLGQETLQAMAEQYKKEIELFKDNLDRLEKGRKRMDEQWAVDKELMELQMEGDNNDKITPTFKFEESPRYKELIMQKVKWKYEQECHLEEQRTEKYLKDKETLEEQLDSAQKALDKIKGDLND